MERRGVVTTLLAIALAAAVIMIVAAIVDLVTGVAGWSAWVSLVCGVVLGAFAVYRLIPAVLPAGLTAPAAR